MKTLITRSLSGIVFLIIVASSIMLGSYVFAAFMLIISLIGLWEYANLRPSTFSQTSDKLSFLINGFILSTLLILIELKMLEFKYLSLVIAIFLFIVIKTLLRNPEEALQKIAEILFGLVYVVVPFALMVGFHQIDTPSHLPELLIGFFIILWFNDVFAYLVGSMIGRTKLYEAVSPKKTWEGTIGGTILSMAAAYILYTIFSSINLTNWLAIGFLISIFATLGDLTESMFKRQAKVKDSGNIMPGHGGVLDRFDGLLIAAPAIYFYLTITS